MEIQLARRARPVPLGLAVEVLWLFHECHQRGPVPKRRGFYALCRREVVVLRGRLGWPHGNLGQHGLLHRGAFVQARRLTAQIHQDQVHFVRLRCWKGMLGDLVTWLFGVVRPVC